eukprot:5372226-Alexandrium_andersonii.AAC.1
MQAGCAPRAPWRRAAGVSEQVRAAVAFRTSVNQRSSGSGPCSPPRAPVGHWARGRATGSPAASRRSATQRGAATI